MGYTLDVNKKQMLAQIDSDMRKAEREIEVLRVRLDTLRELRGKLASDRSAPPAPDQLASSNALLGPGKAIRGLLADRPGMDQEAIINELRGKIKTKSANQDRLLRNTILNLVRDKLLRKDENGGLFLT